MAKKTKTKKENIIQPLVRDESERHVLEEIFDGEPDEMPTLKSIGYAKVAGGWVSYVITTKGKDVLLVEVSEPDARAIAEESSKINFVEQFVDRGLL